MSASVTSGRHDIAEANQVEAVMILCRRYLSIEVDNALEIAEQTEI